MTGKQRPALDREPPSNRVWQRTRARAHRRLARLYPEEFQAILHEEKHRGWLAHRHSPLDPETIWWWGEAPGGEP